MRCNPAPLVLQEGATIRRLGLARCACIPTGMKIDEVPPPDHGLIAPFSRAEAHYVDCFRTPVAGSVPLSVYIRAFYTQPLFQAERLVLRLAAGARSTDAEAEALASGDAHSFAVWEVSARTDHDILLIDRSGRTMSWLMVAEDALYFGSVVVPQRGRNGKLTLGPVFHSLLGAHKVYARALLAGAARRI